MVAILDYLIYLTYALIGFAVVASVVFPLVYTIRNFSKAKGSLLGVLVLVGLFIACVAVSSAETYDKFGITSTVSKQLGGGIIMLYVMTGLAILSALYYEVSKLFK